MFASKFMLCVLAALTINVAAIPLSHGRPAPQHARRGTCRRYITVTATSTGTSAPVAAPTSSSTPVITSTGVTTPSVAPTTTRSSGSSSATSTRESTTTSSASTSTRTSSSGSSSSTSTRTSSSSDAPAPTNVPGGALRNLFPAGTGSSSWSMAPGAPNAVSLSDSSFRPQKVLRTTVHSYANAPDGKRALRARYPEGSYTFGHNPQGGFSFYAPGHSSVDLTRAKEATFGYSVFFPNGWDPVLGGKLPGFYGGDSDEVATSCSGGRRDDRCFSVRLMWRAQNKGEFYTYLPPSAKANDALCRVAPSSHCNPTYGASVGTGAFTFAKGQWTTVAERVKLNDVGQSNGEIELFVNGKSVISVKGLVIRTSGAGRIRGIQMQTFFGGSKPQFATPKDQEMFFSDFSVAVTQTL